MYSTIPMAVVAAGVLLVSTTAASFAAPGDVYEVSGAEKVNLRAGPSQEANIRATVTRGEDLLELEQEGEWLGVRVLTNAQEGWIHSGLVERKASSTLRSGELETAEPPSEKPAAAKDAGFAKLSPHFNSLIADLDQRFGFPSMETVDRKDDRLIITPTKRWLYGTSRETKTMTAVAIYEMWKSYNNGRPVTVSVRASANDTEDLIEIADGNDGPTLTVSDAIAADRTAGARTP